MKVTSKHNLNPETVSIRIPFRLAKRGGRKEMQLPNGTPRKHQTDSTQVKALARAFRWKRLLESGEFASIAELAEREGIASSYMTRVLRLTLLAPEVVEKILADDRLGQPGLGKLLEAFPEDWNLQTWACRKRGTGSRRQHDPRGEGRR